MIKPRDEEIAEIDPAAFWVRVTELLAERGKDDAWLLGQIEANRKTVERWAKGKNRPRWGNVNEILAKLNGARLPDQPELCMTDLIGGLGPVARPRQDMRNEREANRDDFLSRIERACRLRKPTATISRHRSPEPFGAHLRVEVLDGAVIDTRIVAGLEHGLDEGLLDRFTAEVDQPYRTQDPCPTLGHLFGEHEIRAPRR